MGPNDLSVAVFARVLRERGAAEGLRFLNARVAHRYTAICRLQDKAVKSLLLYDRHAAVAPRDVAEVDLGRGLCPFVLQGACEQGQPSPDSCNPHGAEAVPYHSLPLVDASGALFGSLCHFDARAHALSQGEFEFLQHAAVAMAPYAMHGGLHGGSAAPHWP